MEIISFLASSPIMFLIYSVIVFILWGFITSIINQSLNSSTNQSPNGVTPSEWEESDNSETEEEEEFEDFKKFREYAKTKMQVGEIKIFANYLDNSIVYYTVTKILAGYLLSTETNDGISTVFLSEDQF